jgi:hypothetical protein
MPPLITIVISNNNRLVVVIMTIHSDPFVPPPQVLESIAAPAPSIEAFMWGNTLTAETGGPWDIVVSHTAEGNGRHKGSLDCLSYLPLFF